MDEKFWQRFEDTLDRKLEEKLEEKLEKKLDEKISGQHEKTVSAVAVKLGEIVDIVGEQIEEVKLNQKSMLRELRETRKELTARLNFHDYRLEELEEKVG